MPVKLMKIVLALFRTAYVPPIFVPATSYTLCTTTTLSARHFHWETHVITEHNVVIMCQIVSAWTLNVLVYPVTMLMMKSPVESDKSVMQHVKLQKIAQRL